MQKLIFFLFVAVFTVTSAFAQLPEKAEKKKEQAAKKYEDGKVEDARKILRNLTEEYPWGTSIWDMLIKLEWNEYLEKKKESKKYGGMTVTVTKDGKEDKDDPLVKALAEILQNGVYKEQFRVFMKTCREATAQCEYIDYASIMIRINKIDEPVDTAVKKEANKAFLEAEEQFFKKNYNEALKLYKKASELDTTFYKARLYIGDSYYANKEYAEAAKYFKEAIKVKPVLCEPRKYLTDAYLNMGEYDLAATECIKSLLMYPDIGMFGKLETIEKQRGKKFDRYWMPRPVFPDPFLEQEYKGKEKIWKVYLQALKDIKPFCNEKGIIIKSNSLSTSKYAEVYAWEKMMEAAKPEELSVARKMKAAGYLECYLLFSLYHYDLHQQFKDYVGNNRAQVEKYIDLILTR
jgi:tetratricopeptide (TPR) repeat protein